MKVFNTFLIVVLISLILLTSCKSVNKTQTGSAIGTAGGGAIGAIIGRASGNTALGAIIGATVGGVTGAVIGNKMDKQAQEIRKQVPGVKVERIGEGIAATFNSKILFAPGSADLSETDQRNLNELGKVLIKYPDTNIEIQGHSDNVGDSTVNQTLSETRANSVAAYLIKKNIFSERMTTKGFGQTAPKYNNNSEKGRTENRRVEFMITANEKMKEEARKEGEKKN